MIPKRVSAIAFLLSFFLRKKKLVLLRSKVFQILPVYVIALTGNQRHHDPIIKIIHWGK